MTSREQGPERPRANEASTSPHQDDPERIGPYRLLDVLGEGGMGIVYLAERTTPVHRRAALKIIKLGMDTEEVVRRGRHNANMAVPGAFGTYSYWVDKPA